MNDGFGPEYASPENKMFVTKYTAACYCGTVRYEVCADPVDAKICHCLACQRLHGAPMQWAAIFRKKDVRIIAGIDQMRFYNNEHDRPARVPPCKVSCGRCGTPVADEGRRMWLAFPALFGFGPRTDIPPAFRPSCHIFYAMRVVEVGDDLPKWSGHKNQSRQM